MVKPNQLGFTLIELLVVISLIGLLSSTLLVSLTEVRDLAKYTRTRSDIRQLSNLMIIARVKSGRIPLQITGSACTECACRNRGNIQGLPRTDVCWTSYAAAISSLNAAAAGLTAITDPPADPWGAPYLINENEGEGGFGSSCYPDNILSAGPNGQYYDTDDISYNIPETKCSPVAGVHHPDVNWF